MTLLGAAGVAELETESPLTKTTTGRKIPWISVAALEIVSVALFVKITSNQSTVRYINNAFLMVMFFKNKRIKDCFLEIQKWKLSLPFLGLLV
jgi:hypothetical protein